MAFPYRYQFTYYSGRFAPPYNGPYKRPFVDPIHGVKTDGNWQPYPLIYDPKIVPKP